ncbi:homocysteine S-methyltransferase family protein [Tannockella kyphosi]|uniref:homocysteine S-methyltransferase family protein n=1 Tax=Tannockella kyphosi TaxID=2899121 RepID=UPI0029621C34|nr:homocysteine S-methyltransferase family protein [Tannockella kyphosi]
MVHNLLKKEFIFLDGAMGTMLQASGLELGQRPEVLNKTNPELIKNVHKAYIEAGSNIIYANTFGANRHKLEEEELSVEELVCLAIKNAKEVTKGTDVLVALDVGPIGTLLEPLGSLTFEQAYDIFKEIIIHGSRAGADLVVFETMTDLYEAKAAVLAAKENSDLPIFVTMTFEENGRTFTGCTLESMAITLQGLGVDALGINCSLGPKEILPLMQQLSTYTNLPLIAKPNAGLPDPQTGLYDLGAQEFSDIMKDYALAGVSILGGCCGTTKDFIELLIKKMNGLSCSPRKYNKMTRVCSSNEVVRVDTVRVIGERINPTGKKRFAQAIIERDMSYILKQALEQVEAGAEILDVNVGVPQIDEKQRMVEVVKAIQSIVTTPLQIDSSKLEALEAGLRFYNGKPILNSVNGEKEKLDKILPLAKKYGACIVGLTIDEDGIPDNANKRFEIAKKIVDSALSYGIPKEDVLIDCLALTVSAKQDSCNETLLAMERIKNEIGVNMVLGVSNISFGLPNRNLINHSFLMLAMSRGLTLPIINPNSSSMMDAIYAYRVLCGHDKDSQNYIERYNNETISNNEVHQTELTIEQAIMKGLELETAKLTKELLKELEPMHIVNQILIPTLDLVGLKYEKNEIFLPQLIRSANASCSAFDAIKQEIALTSSKSILKGKIILATVYGDVHDIGKNIVKVILENYGYDVIDLGKSVSPQVIVDMAIEQDVSLIGLSALMTTTVESMKETIELIRKSNHPCKIMVGGAVLTQEYAMKIGADYYGKDAKQSADIAKEVLG